MAANSTSLRRQLATSTLFGFDTAAWGDGAGAGRRTISRRGGKDPTFREGALDERLILDTLNATETAAADPVETTEDETPATA